LGTDHVDAYMNTTLDNVNDLTGTWDAELSIVTSADSHFQYNVAAARPGLNRVGVIQDAPGSVWGNNVFLRGTGGSEANDPAVGSNNNVNKTGVGPSAYFQQYQAGVPHGTSITNPIGYRPVASQVATFTPPAALRTLISPWPDPLAFYRPTTGDWAYGALEATTSTSGGGTGGTGGGGGGTTPPPPPSGTAVTIEAESGTTEGGASVVTDNPGYLGTGYIGFFGNTNDVNQINVSVAAAGTYAFRIRFGNAHQPASTTNADIRVNGTVAATVSMPNTAASWSDTTRFQFTTPINIQLNAGANTVRIEHAGAEYTYADLDQYSFDPVTVTQPGGGGGGGGTTGNAPVAAFGFSPTSPNVGQSTSFLDQTANTPTSWLWNFGDGNTSTGQNPTHSYGAAGTYTVTLTATNALGSNSITHNVSVVNIVGSAGSFQHQVTGSPLQNNTAYIVTVEVRDSQGLSASDNEDFSTVWTAPTAPSFTVNP
jgi:PKD repeat protein